MSAAARVAAVLGGLALVSCGGRHRPDAAFDGVPRRTIDGRVLDFATGKPIRAEVHLVGPGGYLGEKQADWNGFFRMQVPDLDDREFQVKALAEGYDIGIADVPLEDSRVLLRLYPSLTSFRYQASSKWIEAHSPGLHVVANTGEDDAREVVKELERVRSVIRSSFPEEVRAFAEPEVPITLMVVRKPDDLFEFFPDFIGRTARAEGLFRRTRFAIDVLLVVGNRNAAGVFPEVRERLQHELHHVYFDRASPWAPLWLREGLAELMSTAYLKQGEVQLGRVPRWWATEFAQMKRIPIARLVKVDHGDPEYVERRDASVFYLQSALFSHYLFFKDQAGAVKLETLGERVQAGVPQHVALEQLWTAPASLDSGLASYVSAREFPRRKIPAVPIETPPPLVFRDVTPSRWKAIRALSLAKSDDRQAAALVAEALVADGSDPLAWEAQAYLREGSANLDSLREELTRASGHPEAGLALQMAALRAAKRGADGTPSDLASFTAGVKRVRQLAPRYSGGALLEAALELKKDKVLAAELAGYAARFAQGDAAAQMKAAIVLRAAGNGVEADALARRAGQQGRFAATAWEAGRVCSVGARAGWAFTVALACERAVALEPDEPQLRDARALQRLLTGDRAGAIDDLTFVLAKLEADDPLRPSRAAWLKRLEKAGDEPISRADLGITDDLFDP